MDIEEYLNDKSFKRIKNLETLNSKIIDAEFITAN